MVMEFWSDFSNFSFFLIAWMLSLALASQLALQLAMEAGAALTLLVFLVLADKPLANRILGS
jgi:hypothetical protein